MLALTGNTRLLLYAVVRMPASPAREATWRQPRNGLHFSEPDGAGGELLKLDGVLRMAEELLPNRLCTNVLAQPGVTASTTSVLSAPRPAALCASTAELKLGMGLLGIRLERMRMK